MNKKYIKFLLFTIFILLFLVNIKSLDAQTRGFSYQAMARDENSEAVKFQTLIVEITLRAGSEEGAINWQEAHQVTTNEFGIFTLIIGKGQTTGNGSFSYEGGFDKIPFDKYNFWIGLRVDFGNGLIDMGIPTMLQSVPFAKVAERALNVENPELTIAELTDVEINPLTLEENKSTLLWNGKEWVNANLEDIIFSSESFSDSIENIIINSQTIIDSFENVILNSQNFIDSFETIILNSQTFIDSFGNEILHSETFIDSIENIILNSEIVIDSFQTIILNSDNFINSFETIILNSENFNDSIQNIFLNSQTFNDSIQNIFLNSGNFINSVDSFVVVSQIFQDSVNSIVDTYISEIDFEQNWGKIDNKVFVLNDSVGIGINNPKAKLHTKGGAIFSDLENLTEEEAQLKYERFAGQDTGYYKYYDGESWKTLGTGDINYNYDGSVWNGDGDGNISYENGNVKLMNGVFINEFSKDSTLSGNSNQVVPTEKAVKTYVDSLGNIISLNLIILENDLQNNISDSLSILENNFSNNLQNFLNKDTVFAGDVNGKFDSLKVVGIYGKEIDTNGIAINKILKYDGEKWIIADDESGGSGGEIYNAGEGIEINENIINNTGDLNSENELITNFIIDNDSFKIIENGNNTFQIPLNDILNSNNFNDSIQNIILNSQNFNDSIQNIILNSQNFTDSIQNIILNSNDFTNYIDSSVINSQIFQDSVISLINEESYWEKTNNKVFVNEDSVGIGTNNPKAKLHTKGGAIFSDLENLTGHEAQLKYDHFVGQDIGGYYKYHNGEEWLILGSGTIINNYEGNLWNGDGDGNISYENGNVKLMNGVFINEFSKDSTLSGNSNQVVPTEKAVKTYVDSLGNTISLNLENLENNLQNNFSDSLTNLENNLQNNFSDSLSNLENNFSDSLSNLENNLQNDISDSLSNLENNLQNNFSDSLSNLENNLQNNFSDSLTNLENNLQNNFSDSLTNLQNNFSDSLSNLENNLQNNFSDSLTNLENDWQNDISDSLTNLENDWQNDISDSLTNLENDWQNDISDSLANLDLDFSDEWRSDISDSLANLENNLQNDIFDSLANLENDWQNDISDSLTNLENDWQNDISDSLTNLENDWQNDISDSLTNLENDWQNDISDSLTNLENDWQSDISDSLANLDLDFSDEWRSDISDSLENLENNFSDEWRSDISDSLENLDLDFSDEWRSDISDSLENLDLDFSDEWQSDISDSLANLKDSIENIFLLKNTMFAGDAVGEYDNLSVQAILGKQIDTMETGINDGDILKYDEGKWVIGEDNNNIYKSGDAIDIINTDTISTRVDNEIIIINDENNLSVKNSSIGTEQLKSNVLFNDIQTTSIDAVELTTVTLDASTIDAENIDVGSLTSLSLSANGNFMVSRDEVISDYTPTGSPQVIVAVTNTDEPRTITLENGNVKKGKILIIKDESGGAGTNNITIECLGGLTTIDGSPFKTINKNYGVLRIYSNGENWFTF